MRRLIIFEAEPYWQPELQRRFLRESVEVAACRSIGDLEIRVSTGPFDGVVLDLAADVSGSLHWLSRLGDRGGTVSVIVVAAADHAEWEWPIRELGATAFVDEFTGGSRMAAVCRKVWGC